MPTAQITYLLLIDYLHQSKTLRHFKYRVVNTLWVNGSKFCKNFQVAGAVFRD